MLVVGCEILPLHAAYARLARVVTRSWIERMTGWRPPPGAIKAVQEAVARGEPGAAPAPRHVRLFLSRFFAPERLGRVLAEAGLAATWGVIEECEDAAVFDSVYLRYMAMYTRMAGLRRRLAVCDGSRCEAVPGGFYPEAGLAVAAGTVARYEFTALAARYRASTIYSLLARLADGLFAVVVRGGTAHFFVRVADAAEAAATIAAFQEEFRALEEHALAAAEARIDEARLRRAVEAVVAGED